ncbi:unnamed protein product [marine sediment metagenome]|uniref:Uncharacterized protein n=1 Tax=marine sediment metagenome TaxID=412755 RepID=X0XV97_9ZZZZ
MPDWSNFYYSFDVGTSTATQAGQMRQQMDEYIQQAKEAGQRAQYLWEQQVEEEKQLQEDKENYPLFFLKEGIV